MDLPLQVADVASIATALTLLVALALGVRQARDMERKRRQDATIDVLKPFQTLDWVEQIRFVRELKRPESPDQLAKNSSEVNPRMMLIVQQMEVLGLLVAERVIELDLVDKILGTFVVSAWEKLMPQIEYAREVTADPKIAEYFQWLAERIDEREKAGSRDAAYLALRHWRA